MRAGLTKARRRGSSAEHEIRDALVTHLHSHLPRARVIHELVCGDCRADIAAVEPDRVLLFEIKSERDTLARLKDQMRAFSAYGHDAVLVAHIKWFDQTPYTNGTPRLAWSGEWGPHIWCYPEPKPADFPVRTHEWRMPRPSLDQPHARRLLGLLWKDELLAESARHRIDVSGRDNVGTIVSRMAWHMTGREICAAVCRQLRSRTFVEADPPITEAGLRALASNKTEDAK